MAKLEDYLPRSGPTSELSALQLEEAISKAEQDIRDIVYTYNYYHPEATIAAFEPAGTTPSPEIVPEPTGPENGPMYDPAGDQQPNELWRAIDSAGVVLEGNSAKNMAGTTRTYAGLSSTLRTDAVAISGSRIMMAEQGVVHISQDNGASFTAVTLGDHGQSEAIATNGSGVWIVAFEAGVVYRTATNGMQWEQITVPITDKQIRDFSVDPDTGGNQDVNTEKWMCCGDNGLVMSSFDGGETWQDEGDHYQAGTMYSMDNDGRGTWVAVGSGGLIMTTNSGTTWSYTVESALGVSGVLYAVCTDGGGNWVAGGNAGQIIYSNNNAASWAKTPVALPNASDTCRHLACGNGEWLMGTSNRRLYWSDSNGIFWTQEASMSNPIYNVIGPRQAITARPLF